MPLDNQNKINHIQTVVTRSFAGRQKQVTVVYLIAGVYSYSLITVIFRHEAIIEPTVATASGAQPVQFADTQIIAPLSTNFVGAVFIADTANNTAGGVAAAQKYEIIEVLPVGIVPGGSHLRVVCRRLR